jgi:hypothetical protein
MEEARVKKPWLSYLCCRCFGFRELGMPETHFPRFSFLGSPVNRSNGAATNLQWG